MLSISKSRPAAVTIDGNRVNFNNEAKVLGLNIKRTGCVSHIEKRIHLAKEQLTKIRRFIGLTTKTKLHLYKALIRPLIEYPIIPLAMASEYQLRKIQRVQNRGMRIVAKYDENLENKTIEDIHSILNLEPMNVRLYRRLEKLWQKIEEKEPELHERSMRENHSLFADHKWWTRAATIVEAGMPDPMYT